MSARLALGTPEWQTLDKGPRGFSTNIAKGGFRLKSHQIDSEKTEGDRAEVKGSAMFDSDKEEDHEEGLRFVLVKKDGRWWITDMK